MREIVEQIKNVIKECGKLEGFPSIYPEGDDESLEKGISLEFSGVCPGSVMRITEHDHQHHAVRGYYITSDREFIEELPNIISVISEALQEYAENEKYIWERVQRIKEVI